MGGHAGENNPMLLLRGARVVLPGAAAEGASVLVEGGRIARIFNAGESLPGGPARALDLAGHTLYPGFIDLHIHGAVGVDTMEADAAGLGRVAHFLAAHGVTGWLPTLVPAPDEDYARAVAAIDELMGEQGVGVKATNDGAQDEGRPGARALGVHYEGPFVNTAQCGALRAAHFRVFDGAASLENLPALARAGASHLITVAPEIDGGVALVGELKSRGCPPASATASSACGARRSRWRGAGRATRAGASPAPSSPCSTPSA
ncbi:MAG: hypothetical protein LC800_22155 [Acidobacteria bacterium]|nr:hypothetical protein [Acidobacteriota bacterium]